MSHHRRRSRSTRAFAALAAVLVTTVACGSSAPKPDSSALTVGILTDVPGFSQGTTKFAGFDITLMNAVGQGLNRPITPTPLSVADRPGYLHGHQAEIVVATYSITGSRNQDGIDFAGPYMVSSEALLVRADEKIDSPADLKGKKVCAVETTTGASVTIAEAAGVDYAATTEDCAKQVAAGKADAVFNDTIILYGFTEANPGKFKIALDGVYGETQYYGIGLLGGQHAFCEQLNSQITTFLSTQWLTEFKADFKAAVDDHPGGINDAPDFQSLFKPKSSDMTTLSCKL